MNRGFAYGDGFFETIRVEGNKVPLLNFHLQRAQSTATFLELIWPREWTNQYFLDLIRSENTSQYSIVRLDFYRSGKGLYTPFSNTIEHQISFRQRKDFLSGLFLLDETWELQLKNQVVKKAYVLENWHKYTCQLSHIKSTSALFYIKAALMAKAQTTLKSTIILNNHGRVCEGLSQNIFYKIQHQWYGIPKEEGPIEGVYSTYFQTMVPIVMQQTPLSLLKRADSIIMTNAADGIVPIRLV